jgi:glycerol-3-phosphate acyltransferase PlsX
MKIALDAMGTDNAPQTELLGMTEALQEFPDIEICLVGKKEIINNPNINLPTERWEIFDAEEVIGMQESPAESLKTKLNSSIAQSINLLKEKKVDAVVSAGNTGAAMAVATCFVGVMLVYALHAPTRPAVPEIGRASCRERV